MDLQRVRADEPHRYAEQRSEQQDESEHVFAPSRGAHMTAGPGTADDLLDVFCRGLVRTAPVGV